MKAVMAWRTGGTAAADPSITGAANSRRIADKIAEDLDAAEREFSERMRKQKEEMELKLKQVR